MGVMSEVELVDRSRVDEIIWKSIGVKSVREIADDTGLRPDEVLRRKNELLDEVDVLSIQQKRQKLVIELDGIARDAREKARGATDEYSSGLYNSSVSAMKTVLQELGRMEKADDSKVEALNQLRVRELMRLVDSVVSATFRQVEQEHGVSKEELMSIFQEHLVQEARALEDGDL